MKKCQQKSSIISASSFVLISFISFLVGCGGDESKLVGKWISESRGSHRDFPNNLELFKDGTGIVGEMSINWKVDNNRFIVTSSSKGFAYNYLVSDLTLTLTNDNGISVEYENVAHLKKLEEKQERNEKKLEETQKQTEEKLDKKRKQAEEAARQAKAKVVKKATMKDKRDGKIYKTVKIGEQNWMAENLSYAADGSKCYENNSKNCEKYGRLYDWKAALEVCPDGWHLPTNLEWDMLYRYVDGSSGTYSPYNSETAGKYLKSKSGWNKIEDDNGKSKSGNGDDSFGFAAMPGGYGSSDGNFFKIGNDGNWWSASENNTNRTYSREITYYTNAEYDSSNKSSLLSVRCLEN